jgi:MFS family permease
VTAATGSGAASGGGGRVALLAALALLTLVPVTLPVPVLRALVQERFGVSELLTSLFMSVNMVGAALAAPAAGALADRFGRRPALAAAAFAADAACFAGLAQAGSFGLFLAVRFLEGCAHILALSMLLSLASTARPPAERGRTMGLVGAAMMLGVSLGAPLGGALGRDDPLLPLRAGAAVSAAAALLAAALLRDPGGAPERRPGLREIASLLRRQRLLAAPLAFAFADRFTVGFFTTTFSLYASRIHELPAPRIGLLITVFMVPFALLSYPVGRLSERTSRTWLLCGGSLVYGVATAGLTSFSGAGLTAAMAFLGVAAAAMFVPSLLLTTELAPASVRSTALGAFNAAGSLGFIVGPLTGGAVSEWVAARAGWEAGYGAAFGVAGGSEILLALALFAPLWRWERGRRPRLSG